MTTRVFLSAGVPRGKRASKYEPYGAAAITDATLIMARVLLRRRARIVTGAQPAISRVLLKSAPKAPEGVTVEIFQSERFRSKVPHTTLELQRAGHGEITWIEGSEGEPEPVSLTRMRKAMLHGDLAAAVFIGGMDGIEEEFSLFAQAHEKAPMFVFAGPGGAARRLPEHPRARVFSGGEYLFYATAIADTLGLPEPSSS
jgi:hypothetical protein